MRSSTKKYLNLLREIIYFQFKIKDQSSVFGFFWSFLNPLIMLAILYAVFSSRVGRDIGHYPIFILIGVIHYTHFAGSVTVGMSTLYRQSHLTCNTIFPKEILVIGSVFSIFIEFVFSMAICLVAAYVAGLKLSWPVLALPFVLGLQLMLVLWISFLLSVLYVYIRDIEHINQVFLRLMFFATPIFYPLSYASTGIAKYIILFNPLTHLMTFSRQLIAEGRLFSIKLFVIFFLMNLVMLILSLRIFRFYEPRFAEHM